MKIFQNPNRKISKNFKIDFWKIFGHRQFLHEKWCRMMKKKFWFFFVNTLKIASFQLQKSPKMPILLILTVIPPTCWTFWLLSMQKWIQDHWIDGQRHKKFENRFRNGHITVIYSFRVAQEAQNHPKLGLYRFETLLDPKSLTFLILFWQKST